MPLNTRTRDGFLAYTREQRDYYCSTWGFDPMCLFVDRGGFRGWRESLPLDGPGDEELDGEGVCVHVEYGKWRGSIKLSGQLRFVNPSNEATKTISCIHTIVHKGTLESLTEVSGERYEHLASVEGSPAILDPLEHFAALRSFAIGLTEVGIYNALENNILPTGLRTRFWRLLDELSGPYHFLVPSQREFFGILDGRFGPFRRTNAVIDRERLGAWISTTNDRRITELSYFPTPGVVDGTDALVGLICNMRDIDTLKLGNMSFHAGHVKTLIERLNLYDLVLQNVELREIPRCLYDEEAFGIRKVDLRQNKISVIPRIRYGGDWDVSYLHLDDNPIEEIDERFEFPRIFSARSCCLTHLPEDSRRYVYARRFDVAGNDIRHLPAGLSEWKQIYDLNVAGNPLASFPDFSFTNIVHVNVAMTGLNSELAGKFPASIKTIIAHNNRMDVLPESYANYPYLTALDLSGNRLEGIRVDDLPLMLKSLNMNGNRSFRFLRTPSRKKIPHIQELRVAWTDIDSLEKDVVPFIGRGNPRKLDIRGCHGVRFYTPSLFPHLEVLNAGGNINFNFTDKLPVYLREVTVSPVAPANGYWHPDIEAGIHRSRDGRAWERKKTSTGDYCYRRIAAR